MDIFIDNLPSSTSVVEVRRLFGAAGTTACFRIVQKLSAAGASSCYGRVMVGPEARARELIERLNRSEIHGARLQARPFVQRSLGNERRALRWRGRPWFGLDRRKGERRNGDRE